MAKTSSEESPEPLKYETWVLKVYIHCEGCKKKVKRVLQSIEGVYMTTVDSQQQKVTVTGNVNAETLIKKLLKTGKQAELWPEKKEKTPGKSKDDKKDAEKNDKGCGGDQKISAEKPEILTKNSDHGVDVKETKEATDTEGSDNEGDADNSEGANGDGEKKRKKKKKKKKKKGTNANSNNNEGSELPKIASNPSLDLNIRHQHLYQDPQMYYPPPVYGMSYNMIHPTASGSYYAPTMSPYPPAPPSEPIGFVARDEYDYVDENIGCLIM